MKSARLVLAILGGLAMTLLMSVSLAQAQSTPVTTCGQVLARPGDYHLTGNLACDSSVTGNGVEITASNVHFTLAGFTISNSDNSCTAGPAGIHVNPGGVAGALSGVRIDGGTVTGFSDGINLNLTSKSRVTGMKVTGACYYGIVLSTAPDNEIDANVVTGSAGDGVGLAGAIDNQVHSNYISENFRYGVLITNTSNDNTIRNNILTANGLSPLAGGAGVFIANGAKNHILSNAINANLDGVSLSTVVSQNTIEDNTVNGNAGIGISTAATATKNKVQGNTARGNVTFDLTDGNSGCDSNTWKNNTFGTDEVAGAPDGGPGTGCIQ